MDGPKVTVYRDNAGDIRWRCAAGNGEIVAVGEAHNSEADAIRAARSALAALATAFDLGAIEYR